MRYEISVLLKIWIDCGKAQISHAVKAILPKVLRVLASLSVRHIEVVNLVYFLKYLDDLVLVLKEFVALNGESVPPHLLLLAFHFVLFGLPYLCLSAILISRKSPVELTLDAMAKDMRLMPLLDMPIINFFQIANHCHDVLIHKKNVFIPFLVNNAF